jgi:hypothetical protein
MTAGSESCQETFDGFAIFTDNLPGIGSGSSFRCYHPDKKRGRKADALRP